MKEVTHNELQEIGNLIRQVTEGPWETGVSYSFARVNDGSGPDDWEAPSDVPEGGCVWCHPKFPEARFVADGTGPAGENYHIHSHNEWVATGLENVPEKFIAQILEENDCTREEYDAIVQEEQDKIDNDPKYRDAPWRFITSSATYQTIVGMYHYEQGGVCTNKFDAEFIAQSRELIPRLVEALKKTMPIPMDFPKEEYDQIEKDLLADRVVCTTRMSKEKDKYHQDQVLLLPFKFIPKAIVKQVEEFDSLEDHPYLDELSPEQKELLGGNSFKVIWFYRLRT